MRKLFAKMRREEGVTLIELLAVMSIMGLVLGIISTTIFFGFRSYNRISVENDLRDQGDVIMSAIITELYTAAPDRIYPLTDAKTGRIYGLRLVKEKLDETLKLKVTEEIISDIVISDEGQIEIHEAKKPDDKTPPPTDPYQFTQIRGGSLVVSNDNTASSISLEGEGLNVFGYLKTGLINIKLVLRMNGGSDSSEITLESRFGF